MTRFERSIYNIIRDSYGISARDIARALGVTSKEVNRRLTYGDLAAACRKIDERHWVLVTDRDRPHIDLKSRSTFYSIILEFCRTPYEAWFQSMQKGYMRMRRPFSDARGLYNSMQDTYEVLQAAFAALDRKLEKSEVFFEFNPVLQGRRQYIDVLIIIGRTVFVMEFKMLGTVLEKYKKQTAKYVPNIKEMFRGQGMTVVPILVLTRAEGMNEVIEMQGAVRRIYACSGDMLATVMASFL